MAHSRGCHAVGAKSGRLESLSGGSKQSQSTSSKLRLRADSSDQIASSLQHVDSDADSHPQQTDSQPGGGKRSSSVERQRTSDLSSRDVLDNAEDRVKDESQSQDVADVRCASSPACCFKPVPSMCFQLNTELLHTHNHSLMSSIC